MQSKVRVAAICIGLVVLTNGLTLAQTQEATPNKPLVLYPFPSPEFSHATTIIAGLVFVAIGLLKKEFSPLGLTTMLIWRDGRIPRWIAAAFYILLGLLMLYLGMTGKF
jgi:hypothetical protein